MQWIKRNYLFSIGSIMLFSLIFIAFFGRYLPFVDPYVKETKYIWIGSIPYGPPYHPSLRFILGSDRDGRDILSLIVMGTKSTLLYVVLITLIRYAMAIPLAFLAHKQKWGTPVVLKVLNGFFSYIPSIILFVLIATLPPTLTASSRPIVLMLFLAIMETGRAAYMIKAEFDSLSEREFMKGGISIGASPLRILRFYYLPFIYEKLIINMITDMGKVMFLLGQVGLIGIFLSQKLVQVNIGQFEFLSTTLTWPALFAEAFRDIRGAIWIPFFPALAITYSIFTFNLFAQGLQKLLNDRSLAIVKHLWIAWRKKIFLILVITIVGIYVVTGAHQIVKLTMLITIIVFLSLYWSLVRGRTYWFLPGDFHSSWDEYRGNQEIIDKAKRIVSLLRGVKEYKEIEVSSVRGLLICGPDGMGKSFLAQIIANEAKVPFAFVSASNFKNMAFILSILKMKRLYKKARKLARVYGACIIFIDEIEIIGKSIPSAGIRGESNNERSVLNELLLQIDPPKIGYDWFAEILRNLGIYRTNTKRVPIVVTIGATSLPQELDPVLLRPGRFDRKIEIAALDYNGRKDLFQYFLEKVKHNETFTPERAAFDTNGYSPTQIKHVVNETVLIARQRGRHVCNYDDFQTVLETYGWEQKQPPPTISEKVKQPLYFK
jgi:ABC-type dipeptide/oligopeptide/nickel transport system permease subunit/AAA+ superfamily predicted ATPase